MNMRKLVPVLVVVLALTLTTLYFEVFRHMGRDGRYLEGNGTIEVTEIEISSKVAGRVLSIPFDEGRDVKKNDLLVRLDFDELSAQRSSARANLDNAAKNLKRARDLYTSGSVSKKDLDNAETAYSVARAGLDLVSATIDNAVIYSPINGTVLEKNLEVGEMAFPGTAILTVGDLSVPWIRIYVSTMDLKYVNLGQKAEVEVDSWPSVRFPGRVVSISNKAEFTPKTIQTRDERVKLMYAVKILLENPEGKLKPGMPADAFILKTSDRKAPATGRP